jgi:signal transduction histidine kinase
MRLSDFILANRGPILAEWEVFARTCAPASTAMDVVALRDHADEMLTVIAEDLCTVQTPYEQSEKSKGRSPARSPGASTAAEAHGSGRATSGFTIGQMATEFRALRASVVRLWSLELREITSTDLDDLTRFNEAIDQALAESVMRYSEDLDRAREMFVAILGHDLRTPLSAVLTSAKFMLETQELKEPHLTLASRIVNSSTRMGHLVADLLDFTRSRLGTGIPIERAEMSMDKVVHDVVHEVSAAHPHSTLQVDTRGAHQGNWDSARMSQALANLISNAVEHGAADAPVTVELTGDEEEMVIAIHNAGSAIPSEQLNGIFNPMKVRESGGNGPGGPLGNLGLGLYIAAQIVDAHDGTIGVDSSPAHGTTFTIRLPRRM